jgi:protein-arginine kinase activator protein McsA
MNVLAEEASLCPRCHLPFKEHLRIELLRCFMRYERQILDDQLRLSSHDWCNQ